MIYIQKNSEDKTEEILKQEGRKKRGTKRRKKNWEISPADKLSSKSKLLKEKRENRRGRHYQRKK